MVMMLLNITIYGNIVVPQAESLATISTVFLSAGRSKLYAYKCGELYVIKFVSRTVGMYFFAFCVNNMLGLKDLFFLLQNNHMCKTSLSCLL